MNRVGLKDYLLNHADDNDLLDCAKAWDAANEYGQFDTYSSCLLYTSLGLSLDSNSDNAPTITLTVCRCAIISSTVIPQVTFEIDRTRHETVNSLRSCSCGEN